MALTPAQSAANAAMTSSGNYTFGNGETVNSAAQSKGGTGVVTTAVPPTTAASFAGGTTGTAKSAGSAGPTSYPVVTSGPATANYNSISSDYASNIKPNIANATNSAAAATAANAALPVISGYDVSATPTGNQGEEKATQNGNAYYITPQKPALTASDVQGILGGDTSLNGSSGGSSADTGGTQTPAQVAQSQTGTNPTTENQNYQNSLQQENDDLTTAYNTFQSTVSSIMSGSFPLNSSQQALVDATNQAFTQMNSQAQLKAAALSSETGGVSNMVNATAGELTNITSDQAAAVAKLELGFQQQDYQMVTDSYNEYKDLEASKTDSLTKMHDSVMQTYNDALAAAQKTSDDVDSVAEDAAKNGADAKTIGAIQSSQSVGDAISAAGDYLQTATGTMGDYLQYKRDAQSQGLTPMDYQTFENKQSYNDAYSKAAGTAAGQLSGSGTDQSSDASGADSLGNTPNGSILSQTGLSLAAFNYLTQGTSALTRMTAAQRQQYINEANSFLNENGIDVSTFQSQYKAYNTVLQNNIERANNTKVFAGEVSGTADNFINDIDSSDLPKLGSLKAADIVAIAGGKQVNNQTAMKYSFDLQTLTNDYAGYLAASRGASSPDDADLNAAANVISNGLNGGSVQAFKDSVESNEAKVSNVVQSAVNSTQQQVWSLFGVGDKYQAPVDYRQGVDDYVSSLPKGSTEAANISAMYAIPGATDQQIYSYLKSIGKIQ